MQVPNPVSVNSHDIMHSLIVVCTAVKTKVCSKKRIHGWYIWLLKKISLLHVNTVVWI